LNGPKERLKEKADPEKKKKNIDLLKKAAAKRGILGNQRGSIEVRTLDPKLRARLEEIIIDAKRKGKKLSSLIEEMGFNRETLLALRQIRQEMDRDARLMKDAPKASGKIVNKTQGKAYVDKNTGEKAFRQYPPVYDWQQQHVIDLADVFTRQNLLEVSGRFLDRLGNLGPILKEAYRDNDGNRAREITKVRREAKQIKKSLSRQGRRELTREFYQNQEGGEQALAQMKMERSDVPIEARSPEAAVAYQRIRELYDDLGRRANEVRKRSGKQPFKWQENYGPFILDAQKMGKDVFGSGVEDIYAMYNDYMADVGFRHEKSRRRGKEFERVFKETDPFKILDGYADQALKYIHHGEQVAWVKQLLDSSWREPVIKDGVHVKDAKGNLKYRDATLRIKNQRLYQSLANWNNAVAGKIPKSALSPKAQSLMRTLSNSVVFSTMSYNLGSYLNQTAALIQANMVLGEKNLTLGVYDLIDSGMPGSTKFKRMMETSNEMARRFGAFDPSVGQSMYGSKFGKIGRVRGAVGKAGMMPVAVTDFGAAAVTWFGAYRQGMKLLKNEKRAAMYADDVVIKTQGTGAAGEVAPIQRVPEGKFATTLQTFAISNWNFSRIKTCSGIRIRR